MKNKAKMRLILLALALVALVTVVCVIGIGEKDEVFTPYVIDPEIEKEIEDAWYRKEYERIDLSNPFYRYYGAYADCQVYFASGPQADSETKRIAGNKISYKYPFEIWVYHAGEFTALEQAYKDGILTWKQVSAIADYHEKMEKYCEEADVERANHVPDTFAETMPHELAALRQEFESAWQKEMKHDFDWERFGQTRYYGTYDDCVVVFNASPMSAITTKEIAGETFSYNVYFTLHVYYNGTFTTLEQAYGHGLISKEQVALIADYHRNAENYLQ